MELRIITAVACLTLGACERKAPAAAASNAPDPVRITSFYAAPESPFRGEKAMLCYGVENADAVTLDPPVDRVWPALTHCIEVVPAKSTTYTLTASRGVSKVSQSVTVTPGPSRLHIVEVSINKLEVARGETVTVCYKVRNASEVTVRPGNYVLHRPDSGCVADRPANDTTYVVTASGPGGQRDSERVTAKVR